MIFFLTNIDIFLQMVAILSRESDTKRVGSIKDHLSLCFFHSSFALLSVASDRHIALIHRSIDMPRSAMKEIKFFATAAIGATLENHHRVWLHSKRMALAG